MKQGHPWLNSCMAWTILQTHDDMKRYPRPLRFRARLALLHNTCVHTSTMAWLRLKILHASTAMRDAVCSLAQCSSAQAAHDAMPPAARARVPLLALEPFFR